MCGGIIMKKIGIIGSGISGLSAALLLSQKHQITLFEKDNLIVNVDKSFQNLNINPQDTLQILQKIVVN